MTASHSPGASGDQQRGKVEPPAEVGPAHLAVPAGSLPLRQDWLHPKSGTLALHWIAVHGSGKLAFTVAEQLQENCEAYGIRLTLASHDEFRDEKDLHALRFYNGFLLILPSLDPQEVPLDELADLEKVVNYYRQHNPHGREALTPGRSHMSRVIQAYYIDSSHQHPRLRELCKQACDAHRYNADGAVDADVLDTFQPGAPVRKDAATNHLNSIWARLQRWGIDTIDDALGVLEAINAFSSSLSVSNKHTLRRPLVDSDLNQLQLLIDDPDRQPTPDPRWSAQERKDENEKYRASGARVLRMLFAQLKETYPNIRRPDGRQNKKGSQRDFAIFYANLKAVEQQVKIATE